MPIKGHLDTRQTLDSRSADRRQLWLETRGTLPDGDEANVTVHNVSTTGMLIETSLRLDVGEKLAIELPEAGQVAAEIVWSSDNLYGSRFVSPISAAELAAAELRSDAFGPLGANIAGTPAKLGGAAFGKRLEQLRKSKSMTLSDVAERLGVSKPTVWAWEKGKARPIEDRFPALARVLGIEQEELLGMASPSAAQETLEEARALIAEAFGVTTDKIRVMVEL